jgi:hypothetical protein
MSEVSLLQNNEEFFFSVSSNIFLFQRKTVARFYFLIGPPGPPYVTVDMLIHRVGLYVNFFRKTGEPQAPSDGQGTFFLVLNYIKVCKSLLDHNLPPRLSAFLKMGIVES